VLQEADLYGTKDIILPFVQKDLQNSEGFVEIRRTLREIANKHPEYRFSYHNHAFEFDIDINGLDGLRYMLDPEADSIFAELDVYWLKKAGNDPLAYIAPYANKMPIIHLKDMTS